MKISVIGTGYVGLVSGTGFAEMGNDVFCADVDTEKIDNLNKGIVPIYEPGLDKLVEKNLAAKRLHFTHNIPEAVQKGQIIFIAVGTPSDEDGSADLKYVLSAAKSIGENMNDHKVVVTKSTVPVGTCGLVQKEIERALQARGKNIEFDVVSNPEFLKEGAAVEDFLRPDRVVVGVSTNRARELMQKLYEPFVRNNHTVLFMDTASSEMTKYTANAMLATKISFINEISRLCEKVGADVEEVRKGIGFDQRIGHHFIYPGLGYGGSCFPKDVKALVKTGKENKQELQILQAVEAVNQQQRQIFLNKITSHFSGDLNGKTFALWGLAFKPGTDDMREAPAQDIVEYLVKKGAKVHAYDPVAGQVAQKLFQDLGSNFKATDNNYQVLEGADGLILATEWREFRKPDFARMKELMANAVIFDGRNQYDPKEIKEHGFAYYGFGRRLN